MSPADDIFSGKNKFDGELSEENLEKAAGGTLEDTCFWDNPCTTECRGDGCGGYACRDEWTPNLCGANCNLLTF